MNPLDSIISWVSPAAGVRRAQHRRVLAYYEAASPNRMRKGAPPRARGTCRSGGRAQPARAGALLRAELRHCAGRARRPRVENGRPDTASPASRSRAQRAATFTTSSPAQILELWRDWCRNPEVTFQHDWPSCQRLLARSWLRDGDVFAQIVQGTVKAINHGTTVPLSLEMIEADLVPLEYSLPPSIVQGVEVNEWGRPIGYHILRTAAWRRVHAVVVRGAVGYEARRRLTASCIASLSTAFASIAAFRSSPRSCSGSTT
jgi:capsid protein